MEIMFRGQSWKDGKLVYGYYFKIAEPYSEDELMYVHYILTGDSIYNKKTKKYEPVGIVVAPETVAQFLGKDKHGKDIYVNCNIKNVSIVKSFNEEAEQLRKSL